jgi:subtilisin family serine protease
VSREPGEFHITNPSAPDCIAFELRAEAVGNCAVVSWNMPSTAINVGTPPELVVGVAPDSALVANVENVIVLCSATVLLLDGDPVTLRVSPSSGGVLGYVSTASVGEVRPLMSISGDASSEVAWINSADWPCVTGPATTTLNVKTAPGLIEIANERGGDVIANITVNSALLDSVISYYQIPEIKKYTEALPDSVNYVVRGTNELCTSYLFRDHYAFAVPSNVDLAAFAAALDSVPGVLWTSFGDTLRYQYLPNDPELGYHIGSSPANGMVDVQRAWDLQRTNNVVVAIIDSGIDEEHQDLNSQVSGELGYLPNEAMPEHGTAVAGLVGATWDNHYAGCGMAQCQLLNKKCSVAGGGTELADSILDVMASNAAAIANVSSGLNVDNASVRLACEQFYNSNRLLVTATGNNGTGYPIYPARYYDTTFAVGGVDAYGQHDPNANWGTLDVVAPSVNVPSTTVVADPEGDEYHCKLFNGTSFASAVVSGAAAVLLSYNPELYVDDLMNILSMSARVDKLANPAPRTYSEMYGHGIIQVGAALDSLLMNVLVSGEETGYDFVTETSLGTTSVKGLPGPDAPDGSYWNVTAYQLHKYITYPVSFVAPPHVWGRGPATTGLKDNWSTHPHRVHQERHVYVEDQTISGCRLMTTTFKFVKADQPNLVVWYPADLNHIAWGYAALGRDGVVAVPDGTPASDLGLEVAPNPFNARTTLSFGTSKDGEVDVAVYDIRGQKVTTLIEGVYPAGAHSVVWSGTDGEGRPCASAVYFVRVRANGRTFTKSFV